MPDPKHPPRPLRVVVEVSRNGFVDVYADPGVVVYVYDRANTQATDQAAPQDHRGWCEGNPDEVNRALDRLNDDLSERLEEGRF